MTEIDQTARTSAAEQDEPVLLPIVRGSSFARIAADDIIVVHRQRDVQISLIAAGPEPTKQALNITKQDGFNIQDVELTFSYTEIARVALPPGTAFSMAMNIIEAAVANGNVPIEQFRARFLAMLDEHVNSNKRPKNKPSAGPRKK